MPEAMTIEAHSSGTRLSPLCRRGAGRLATGEEKSGDGLRAVYFLRGEKWQLSGVWVQVVLPVRGAAREGLSVGCYSTQYCTSIVCPGGVRYDGGAGRRSCGLGGVKGRQIWSSSIQSVRCRPLPSVLRSLEQNRWTGGAGVVCLMFALQTNDPTRQPDDPGSAVSGRSPGLSCHLAPSRSRPTVWPRFGSSPGRGHEAATRSTCHPANLLQLAATCVPRGALA